MLLIQRDHNTTDKPLHNAQVLGLLALQPRKTWGVRSPITAGGTMAVPSPCGTLLHSGIAVRIIRGEATRIPKEPLSPSGSDADCLITEPF